MVAFGEGNKKINATKRRRQSTDSEFSLAKSEWWWAVRGSIQCMVVLSERHPGACQEVTVRKESLKIPSSRTGRGSSGPQLVWVRTAMSSYKWKGNHLEGSRPSLSHIKCTVWDEAPLRHSMRKTWAYRDLCLYWYWHPHGGNPEKSPLSRSSPNRRDAPEMPGNF